MSAPSPEGGQTFLPRTVWLLGVVSFLNDVASEMVYPLLPVFLTGVLRASPMAMGGIEAAAEAIPSLLKGYFGRMADRPGRRKPLTLAGYGLSGVGKAVLALATAPMGVAAARWTDRVGKGVRTGARDAMIAAATPPERMGRAFGVHRAMDSAGATVGPLIAYGFLRAWPGSFRPAFALAAVVALAGCAVLAFAVHDAPAVPVAAAAPAAADAGGPLPGAYWTVLAAATVFALGNSSDTFLLLRTHDMGVRPANVALMYAFFNAVYAAASGPLGIWSDRVHPKRVLMLGYLVFGAVYLGFAHPDAPRVAWLLWGAYGVYVAATDGVQKALVARLVPAHRRGAAFGTLGMFVGFAVLPASLLAGALYGRFGPAVPFTLSAVLAFAAAVIIGAAPLRGISGTR